jgi:hypothetical protein
MSPLPLRFNRCWTMVLALVLVVSAAAAAAARPQGSFRAAPPANVTFMGTLAEWKYPGSAMPGGASMSDGGNPRIQSIRCRTILTTPDPIEKVIAFYAKKTVASPAPGRRDAGDGAEGAEAEAKSVSSQDDSEGRPVTLRVIVVNRDDTSTTLVISRAAGETETHIAWLHYLRLGGGERRP